jgi:toxin YoeB
MAFKIVWSEKALIDLSQILNYWVERNKSNLYSLKLSEMILNRVELLAKYPNLGKRTNAKEIRAHLVKDYFLFYKIKDKNLIIISVFDTRKDPKKIKRRLK